MTQAAQPQPERQRIPRHIALALGIIGDSSTYQDSMTLSKGPLLDPYFQLAPPVSDRLEGWRITGIGLGTRTYGSREEAREVFQRVTGTIVSLRDALKTFGSIRLDSSDMGGHDHLFAFWVMEKVVQHFLDLGGNTYEGAALAIQHWLEGHSAGTQFDLPVTSWAAEQELGMRSSARVPRDSSSVRESPFFAAMQRMSTARCIYVDPYVLAARELGITNDLGLSFNPGIAYPDGRTPGRTRPVKMSPQVLAYAWGRLKAYQGGLPRIPVEVLANLGRRPGALRLLTTWVFRCGLRSNGINNIIPNALIGEVLGYDVASLKKLRQLVSENLDRLALILKLDPQFSLPRLEASGLVLPGIRGAQLAPKEEPKVTIFDPAKSAEGDLNLRHQGTEDKPPTPGYFAPTSGYQTSDTEVPDLRHRGAETSDTEVPEPPTSRYPSYTSLSLNLTHYLEAVAEGQVVPTFETFFREGGEFVNEISKTLGNRLFGELCSQSMRLRDLPFPEDPTDVTQAVQVVALCHASLARRMNLAPWGRSGYGLPQDRAILNKPPIREAVGFVREEPQQLRETIPMVITSFLKAGLTGMGAAASNLQEPHNLNTAVQDWISAAAILYATEPAARPEIHRLAVSFYLTVLKPHGWLTRGSEVELGPQEKGWMGVMCMDQRRGEGPHD